MISPDLYPTIIRLAPFGALNGLARSCRSMSKIILANKSALVAKYVLYVKNDAAQFPIVKKCLPNGWPLSIKITDDLGGIDYIDHIKFVDGRPDICIKVRKSPRWKVVDGKVVQDKGSTVEELQICRYNANYHISADTKTVFSVMSACTTGQVYRVVLESGDNVVSVMSRHAGSGLEKGKKYVAAEPAPSKLEELLAWYERYFANIITFDSPNFDGFAAVKYMDPTMLPIIDDFMRR